LPFISIVWQLFSCTYIQTEERSDGKNLEIELSFPNSQTQGQRNPCLKVNVLIINHTDTVASFFEDWNSWGYFNINFQIKSGDSTYTIYKRVRAWDKNFPSYETLFPGDTMELKFFLDYGHCSTSPFNGYISITPNGRNTIKAIYKLDAAALKNADLEGYIKYKQVYIPDKLITIDSLKTPVEINRTFPISKLESKEYRLR
jgi:hypothetical protein